MVFFKVALAIYARYVIDKGIINNMEIKIGLRKE